MNSLVAGSSSRTRAGLASLSAACCRVAIVTGLTALAPRPGRVVETLLWGGGWGGELNGIKKEEVSSRPEPHYRIPPQLRVSGEEGKRETYHTAARLGVAAAGVTVALAPLAGAQVKAGAGAGVAVVALLQNAERKEEKKRKKITSGEGQVSTKREYVFVPLQHGNRHTAIIIKD